MKWFKHLVESGDDPDIGAAMEEFGFPGYYVFFRTLEVMSREFDVSKPGRNTFNMIWFCKRMAKLKQKTVIKILSFYDKKGRIKYKINGKEISLYCPKLKDLADDYTKKMLAIKSGQNPDKIRTKSGKNPSQDKDRDKDKDKESLLGNKDKIKEKKSISLGKSPNYAEVDQKLTQHLIDLMLENNPNSSIIKRLTEKRQLDWMNQCRLMRERDGRTPEDIRLMIDFSQTDEFWKSNILSMPKLREKFDQLWLKAQNKVKQSPFSGIKEWLEERGYGQKR
jgi:hypothetical protein